MCPRYFALKYRFGLVPKGVGYSSAREVGTIAHMMMSLLVQGASLDGALRAATKYIDDLELEPIQRSIAQKDLAMATAMTVAYWQRFALDSTRWNVIGSEVNIIVEIPGIESPIEGTIDLLLWDREKNEIWIHDLKTTGKDPQKRQATAAFDPQTRIYRLLAEGYIRIGAAVVLSTNERVPVDTPVVGVQYNVIKRPSIRQKDKYKPEGADRARPQTYDEYLAEVADWYAGRGEHEGTTTGGAHAVVPPYPCRFTGELITYEFAYQLRLLDAACGQPPGVASCPRTLNVRQCEGVYGNSECPYLQLCGSSPLIWPRIVKTCYDRDPQQEGNNDEEIPKPDLDNPEA